MGSLKQLLSTSAKQRSVVKYVVVFVVISYVVVNVVVLSLLALMPLSSPIDCTSASDFGFAQPLLSDRKIDFTLDGTITCHFVSLSCGKLFPALWLSKVAIVAYLAARCCRGSLFFYQYLVPNGTCPTICI